MCIDKNGCPMCTVTKVADLTKGPIDGIADDSAVVFVSCVLEYVTEPEAALRELQRIAGSPDNLFLVFVEPWTITAALYPGAQWAGGADANAQGKVVMQPVTTARKVAVAGSLGLLALAAVRRRDELWRWPPTNLNVITAMMRNGRRGLWGKVLKGAPRLRA